MSFIVTMTTKVQYSAAAVLSKKAWDIQGDLVCQE